MRLDPSFHAVRVARSLMSRRPSRKARWTIAEGPRDPAAAILGLLDEAHRELATPELAETLLDVRRAAAPLALGNAPIRPESRLRSADRLTPAARAYVRPIRVLLDQAVRDIGAHDLASLASLGNLIDAYVEEIAARPRGSGIAAP